jgi:hypothetical protein
LESRHTCDRVARLDLLFARSAQERPMSSAAERRNWREQFSTVREGRSSPSDVVWVGEYIAVMDKISSNEVDGNIISHARLCSKLALQLSNAKVLGKRRQLY